MIVDQRRDKGHESVLFGVMIESIPENRFGLLRFERGEFLAAARGDEIDCVVAVPMLETMLTVGPFAVRR